jgi:hypothetical protein
VWVVVLVELGLLIVRGGDVLAGDKRGVYAGEFAADDPGVVVGIRRLLCQLGIKNTRDAVDLLGCSWWYTMNRMA